GMASVALPADEVRDLLAKWSEELSVAVVNAQRATVVAGESAALSELLAACEADGVRARRIEVDYASHSAQMDTIREELLDVLQTVRPSTARVRMFSTVDLAWVEGPELTAEYWYRNLRQAVQFDSAVRALAEAGFTTFVEASPHPVLTAGVQESLAETATPIVVTGTLRRGEGGLGRLLLSLGEIHVQGVPVDWAAVFDGSGARRVEL